MHNLLTGVGLILFPQCYLKSACSTNFFKIRLNPQQAYYFTECYILPHVAPRVAPTIPFVQLAQKLLLLPASPFTAIHAAQLCLYSPKEQGSALLLTRLAAPPARPYPFHGHSLKRRILRFKPFYHSSNKNIVITHQKPSNSISVRPTASCITNHLCNCILRPQPAFDNPSHPSSMTIPRTKLAIATPFPLSLFPLCICGCCFSFAPCLNTFPHTGHTS